MSKTLVEEQVATGDLLHAREALVVWRDEDDMVPFYRGRDILSGLDTSPHDNKAR